MSNCAICGLPELPEDQTDDGGPAFCKRGREPIEEHDFDCAIRGWRRTTAEVVELRAVLARVLPLARHGIGCAVRGLTAPFRSTPCDCGLDEARALMEKR